MWLGVIVSLFQDLAQDRPVGRGLVYIWLALLLGSVILSAQLAIPYLEDHLVGRESGEFEMSKAFVFWSIFPLLGGATIWVVLRAGSLGTAAGVRPVVFATGVVLAIPFGGEAGGGPWSWWFSLAVCLLLCVPLLRTAAKRSEVA